MTSDTSDFLIIPYCYNLCLSPVYAVISQGTPLLLKHTEVLSTCLGWNVAVPVLRVGP